MIQMPRSAPDVQMLRRRVQAWASPVNVLSFGLFMVSLGTLFLRSTGRIDNLRGTVLLLGPAIAAVALLRPAWVLLALLITPPDFLSSVTPRLLLFGVLGALLALAARESKLYLGPSTGTWPIIALVALALVHEGEVSGEGADVADGLLKLFQYYVALMLLAYNAIRLQATTVRHVAVATVAGSVIAAVLNIVDAGPLAGSFSGGRNAAYLTAYGMLVAVGWLLLGQRDHDHPRSLWGNAALIFGLGIVTALMLVRATWVSALLAFVVMAIWTQKGRWLVAIPLVATLILAVPVSRDRVVPADLGKETTLAQYTTGRWDLWEALVEESAKGMPLGQGWGHWWSLTPKELFGVITFVSRDDQPYVYAHNDWLYLSVDTGVIGPGLLTLFWFQLIRAHRRLARRPGGSRDASVVLVGVPATFLLVQLVDNGVALQPVAEKFFIIAGVVFGVHAIMTKDLGIAPELLPHALPALPAPPVEQPRTRQPA